MLLQSKTHTKPLLGLTLHQRGHDFLKNAFCQKSCFWLEDCFGNDLADFWWTSILDCHPADLQVCAIMGVAM